MDLCRQILFAQSHSAGHYDEQLAFIMQWPFQPNLQRVTDINVRKK